MSKVDSNKELKIQYVDLIVCMGGSFDCSVSDVGGVKTPNLYETREEGEAELQDIVDDYLEQVEREERDNADLDLEIFPCTFDGKILSILDDNNKVYMTFDCTTIDC